MADRYGKVIVSGGQRGVMRECIVSGTPKPGTCMTVVPATEPINGVFTYRVFTRAADANFAPVAVILEDSLQGIPVATAYATLTRGMLYFPLPGDRLQMLVANIAGTGDVFAIGDYLIIDDTTGKLIATTGSPEMESFVCMETVGTAITVDTLVLCEYTGN